MFYLRSPLILVRFSWTSISFFVIVLPLIKRELRKHINIDLIKAKLIFLFTLDFTVDFGKSSSIANNSLSFETEDLQSIPIVSYIVNISGVKLACSTSKILLLQRRFFSRSFTAKHCLRLLDWYRELLG